MTPEGMLPSPADATRPSSPTTIEPGWPGRVKSATLQAIPLAESALAYAHGWAVNSQVALLTKEISIAFEPAFGRGEP